MEPRSTPPSQGALDMPPLNLPTRMAYGVGSAATGIVTRSFSAFLLIFYNQAVGMPPELVATAILIATIYDAIIDPVIGQISDNFRSRWGRRHPFMYVAAVPVGVGFYLLWTPPAGLSHEATFAYLLTCLLIVRTFDTFFELPNTALGPELAPEYNERTKLISWRRAFEMCGGLLMVLAGYRYFMAEDRGGITERAGYAGYALVGSLVIMAAILVSARGTHHLIGRLRQPPRRQLTPLRMLGEIFATLRNSSFLFMAAAGIVYMSAIGARQALEIYFYLYFWSFDQAQIAMLTLAQVPASLVGVLLAPLLANLFGKKQAALLCWGSAMIVTLLPLVLRVAGILPGGDHWVVFPTLLAENVLTQILLIAGAVLVPAMLADIVEDSELRTGRRSEGLLFSADNLFRKCVSGVGVFVAGWMLAAVGFTMKTPRGAVSEHQLDLLALIYVPVYAGLVIIAMLFLARYRITRASHEDNLRQLRAREAEAEMLPGPDEIGIGTDLPRATRPNPVHP